MITVICSTCKGTKGYSMGSLKTRCHTCFGAGTVEEAKPEVKVRAKRAVVKPVVVPIVTEASHEREEAEAG